MKLVRTVDGKILGGVCAGLEKYNNIPVAISRIIFIVAMFPLAVVIPPLVYIGLWVFVPDEEGKSSMGSKPSSSKKSSDLETELRRIDELKSQNLISEEDFKEVRAKAMSVHVDGESGKNDEIKIELRRLQQMFETGMINEDELNKLRKKALGID